MTVVNPFQKAVKSQLKARLALAGPTGSGKTWSALEWARVLGKNIALIDTERGSAALYADHFEFDTLDMPPPYDPHRCVEALKAAEANGYDVVILDSMSHFWQGEGGTLDIVDAAAQRMGGNKYAGWSVGTPALRHLVDTMLAIDVHLIVTMRSKMDYVEVEKNGRKTYERVGMAPVMRDGIEYEFTLLGDIDLEHRIVISKSRCDLLADRVVQPGRAADAAETFRTWLEQGEPVAARSVIEELVERMNALDEETRKACKTAFFTEFGRPEHLLAHRGADAESLVASYEQNDIEPPPDGGGQDSAPDESSARDGDEPKRDAAGVNDYEEMSPSATPADSIEPGQAGADNSAPAARERPDPEVYRDVDIHKLIAAVFESAKNAAPRGQKSKIIERIRHTFVWAITSGAKTSLTELTAAEKHRVWTELSHIERGFNAVDVTDTGLIIRPVDRPGDPISIPWVDTENGAAA